MRKLEERERAATDDDKSKRKYHSMDAASGEHVTEEEMEAYRLRKSRGEDPMAAAAKGGGTVDGYDLL